MEQIVEGVKVIIYLFIPHNQNTISPDVSPALGSLLSSDEVTQAHPSHVVTPTPSQHQHCTEAYRTEISDLRLLTCI